MKIRIVSDSASNLYELPGADYVAVPMKIIAGDKVYVDNPELNVRAMVEEMSEYRGKSNTAHPGIRDWKDAFGDADVVYGITVTSALSGSYNSASFAAEAYMEEHPGRQVYILDSRSTGPEMELVIEKYKELIDAGKSFDEIRNTIRRYHKRTRIWWSMESMQNFVNNGKVNSTLATIIRVFGISVVGTANESGELEPQNRCHGSNKALKQIYADMLTRGFNGGKVRIRHTYNRDAADALAAIIREEYPECDIKIGLNKGLCGYYVEKGGLVVAAECDPER